MIKIEDQFFYIRIKKILIKNKTTVPALFEGDREQAIDSEN